MLALGRGGVSYERGTPASGRRTGVPETGNLETLTYVHMYIHIYMYMHMYIYIYVYICVYVYINISININICMYIYLLRAWHRRPRDGGPKL